MSSASPPPLSSSSSSSGRWSLWRGVAAVFSAMFGVRKRASAEREWQGARLIHFVAAGVLALAVFIATVLLIVRAVVS